MEKETQKCRQCKREIPLLNFMYKGKCHKTCESCSISRRKRKNYCDVCGKQASFNFPGETEGKLCKTCILPGMVNVKDRKCDLCKIKIPIYNFPGETKGIYCRACSLPGMVDVKHRKCVACQKTRPSFNFPDRDTALYCSKCSLPGMIYINAKKCIVCHKINPIYGFPDSGNHEYCNSCKLPGMINLVSKNCIVCEKTRPTYGYADKKTATHCAKCALENMINVKSRKCIVCRKTIPTYGYIDEKIATRCAKCALIDMVNVKGPKCIVCNKVRPSFGYPENKPTHCTKCTLPDMEISGPKCVVCKKKQPRYKFPHEKKFSHCKDCFAKGMISIYRGKKCIICKKSHVSYNFPGEPRMYCAKCAQPGMINITCPRCLVCNKIATYGFPCNKPTSCVPHKEPGMIKNPNRRCSKRGCKKPAVYGIKTTLHCDEHKNDNDIDLTERTCVRCGKTDVVNHEGVCINFCLKEDEFYRDYKKREKLYENRIIKILTHEFGPPTMLDTVIERTCTMQRPDIVYDCKTHMIIVEVDERSHRDRCVKGEHERMKNLFFALGGIPVIFLRYNPDPYKDADGKTVSMAQHKREEILIKWMKYFRALQLPHQCSVFYLFYDGYLETDRQLLEIDPYDLKTYICAVCTERPRFYIESVFLKHVDTYHGDIETFLKQNKKVVKCLRKRIEENEEI